MASTKKKVTIALQCTVDTCKKRNYTEYKGNNQQEKLEKKKFCKHCNQKTMHKEAKIK